VLSNWEPFPTVIVSKKMDSIEFSIDEPLDRASMARSKFPALDGLFLISPSAGYEPSSTR
jgi:hypothetical protein